jgi:hypothetical protein
VKARSSQEVQRGAPQDERVALMHEVLTGVEHWVRTTTQRWLTNVWRGGYGENPELRRELLAETRNGNPWS